MSAALAPTAFVPLGTRLELERSASCSSVAVVVDSARGRCQALTALKEGSLQRLLAVALLCFALPVPGAAFAQDAPPPPPAAPPAQPPVLAEARAQLEGGRVEDACRTLEKGLTEARVYEVLIAAGQCHELLGKTATAFGEFAEASSLAEREGATDKQDRARAMASKLAPRIPKLRIDVIAATLDQIVKRNGAVVPRSDWGKLVFADPGTHVVTASATSRREFSAQVSLGADGDVRVVLVTALVDQNAPPSDAKPVKQEPKAAPPKGDGRTETLDPISVAAFVTTSVGLVGLALGTVFGVMTLSEVGDAEDDPLLCPNKVCSKAGRAVIDEAETKGAVATAAFVVGGVSLATGITLFLVKELAIPAPVIETKGVFIEPVLSPEWFGVRVSF